MSRRIDISLRIEIELLLRLEGEAQDFLEFPATQLRQETDSAPCRSRVLLLQQPMAKLSEDLS